MFLPGRVFTSKNRRTALPIAHRSTSQPIDEQIRALHVAWADVLSLPLCLSLLALYEWWRWLFSMRPNPLLLTMVAAIAIYATRRRRKAYKAELKRLQVTRVPDLTVGELLNLLRLSGRRILHELTRKFDPTVILTSARRVAAPANGIAKRLFARS